MAPRFALRLSIAFEPTPLLGVYASKLAPPPAMLAAQQPALCAEIIDEYFMRIKAILIGVFIILAGWLESAYCTPPDYYPSVKIPIMANGYNVQKVYDNPKYTKSVNYLLNVDYPAQTVIEFYNSRFKAEGWVISNEKSNNEWQSFIDGTIKGEPKIRQRLSLWIKPDLELEAFLALRYEGQNHGWSH